MPRKRLRHRKSRRCVSHQSLSSRLYSVHRRHIRLCCSNHIQTTFEARNLVQHLLCKRFHNRRQQSTDSHSIGLAPEKLFVLWKHHALFCHEERPCAWIHHHPPFPAELLHKVHHPAHTLFCSGCTARFHPPLSHLTTTNCSFLITRSACILTLINHRCLV